MLRAALVLALPACGAAPDAPRTENVARHPTKLADAWSSPSIIPSSAASFRTARHRVVALAGGPGGTLHALFAEDADGDGHADRLLYAAFDGARWSAPRPIDEARRIDSPRLAVDGGGAAHALWFRQAADGRATLVERVRSADRWSAVTPLPARTAGADGSVELAVAATEAGAVEAVFARGDGTLGRLTFAGERWREGAPAGRAGAYVALAAGPGGALALAQVAEGANPLAPAQGARGNVWASSVRPGNAWTPAVGVHPNPAEQAHFPQLAWDRRGVLHAVWLEGERGDAMPSRLLHATSADGGVTWSAAEDVGREAPGRVFYSPRLAVDGRGALHLTFARFRDGVSYPRHYHAVWMDGRWSAAREILPGEGERQSEIETAVGSDGRLDAVWRGADGQYRHARLVARPDLAKWRDSR